MFGRMKKLLKWHLGFCVLYYWVLQLLRDRSPQSWGSFFNWENLASSLIGFVIFFAFMALPYLALRRTSRRPWYITGGALLLAAVGAVAFRYLIEEVLGPVTVGFRNYPAGTPLFSYFLDNLYYVVLHGSIGVILYYYEENKRRERDQQALVVENQRTELAFLRSQINPHFLFNTLNNVYSLLFLNSDRAPKIIERLTVMLRYGLYERSETVLLEREIEYLLNYLELEQLRLDHELELRLSLPTPEDRRVEIPPLLLISFLENAFKHGDLKRPLTVNLELIDGQLQYTVINQVAPHKQTDTVGGIGLENLRRRLELLFPGRYSLKLNTDSSRHTAQLQFPVSRTTPAQSSAPNINATP